MLLNEVSRRRAEFVSDGRYDFFYKNGVPKWRGTGYYYSRFRPGLGVRVLFCFGMLAALTDGRTYDNLTDRARLPNHPNIRSPVFGSEDELQA